MGPGQIAVYLGGAILYAAAATAVLWAVIRLFRRYPGRAGTALAFFSFLVVFLGIHPFPDPATLDCRGGGAGLILEPFDFLRGYVRWWNRDRSLATATRSLAIIAPLMNLILFAPVGAALAGTGARWPVALAAGLGVTGFIEIAQLSALFGLYPCRYRHFETGDLILNTSGVMLGYLLMRYLLRRARRARRII